jgi:hypothetical protein
MFAFRLTVHWPVPPQLPDQPENEKPLAGVAVRVTFVSFAYASEQSVGQLIPGGALVTVPLPDETETLNTGLATAPKDASTAVSPLTVTSQLPVPLQPLAQPEKTYPEAAVALSVTFVPFAYDSEQSDGQLIPAGALVTVPLPDETETLSEALVATNDAETLRSPFIGRMQAVRGIPAQAPPQLPNVKPEAGNAVRRTFVPTS